MSIHSPRRLNPETAEQLLGSPSAGAHTGHPQLAALLAAAAAPGRPDELNSEEAAVSAFLAARHVAIPRQRRLSTVKTLAMKALTVKVLAVLATTTTVGGVALAAKTGALPNPLAEPAHTISSGLSAAEPTATETRAAAPPATRTATAASPSAVPDSPSPSKPAPKLIALCRAYQVGNKVSHGKALDNPVFTSLITAAGGRDKVEPYCTAVLASVARTGDGGQSGSGRDGNRDQSGGGHDRNTRTPRPTPTPGR
ncbi:hypothetical protein HC031_31995 [Planosporangium thailandense]|uniref:DUF732 domain-containing protein n=1 Tax=Planosporangium thailandense TaxID=765197 RepID=A0ABX0YA70_9ACTN|nr:hypothetical protein [Planosporangium thailandense]NJC74303.1 hypothetical protein [Planosporangium thailandense]